MSDKKADKKPLSRVMQAIMERPWAITREGLEQIVLIAERRLANGDMEIQQRLPDIGNAVRKEGNVGLIAVRGPIFHRANLFTDMSGATSAELLALQIQAADADDDLDGIVLSVDSPGGQMGGISDVYDAVRSAEKPVTAYIDSMAASAAYWIASAADEIVMNRSAWAGSIGVVASVYNGDEDVIEIVSSQSPYKRVDFDDEDSVADLQREVDVAADMFIEDVAQGRGVTAKTVQKDFGKGGMLLAPDALGSGMADKIGTLDETITAASKAGAINTADAAEALAVHLINAEVSKA